MTLISQQIRRKGTLTLPGSYSSKKVVEDLLLKDAQEHHCFFNASGFHNHLSHHLLAAYDLGASATLLQKIYENEAKIQRPILLSDTDKQIVITADNWTQYIGNRNAYSGFVNFFEKQIHSSGALSTLEDFVFSSDANSNGVNMTVRLVSGALHPFIQVGYGLEFGNEKLIAAGLAQTAVHKPLSDTIFQFKNPTKSSINVNGNQTNCRQPYRGPSLLELLRQVYDSSILTPVMPYDPNAFISERRKAALSDGRSQEILRICSQYYVDEESGDEEFEAKAEECVWLSTLLLFSTGREGRKPRLDFFLMHLANILRALVPEIFLYTLTRGRPVIKPDLLMSYTSTPKPPTPIDSLLKPDKSCLGDPLKDEDYFPWPALIGAVLYAPDAHVLKTMRTLILAAKKYGDTPPGDAIGAYQISASNEDKSLETHPGTSQMDGTIFVRAAGLMLDYMGWVTHGQPARDDWDRSALGWDDAWANED